MGYPKPLLKIGSQTFIAHTAEAMLTVMEAVVVVLGAHAQSVRAAIPNDPRLTIVENPHYKRGQLSSLKVGLATVPAEVDAVVVHLIDHPTVIAETFRGVIDEYARTRKPIVIARCRGRRGHPVLFDRSIFAELMAAPEDEGARTVVNADPARVLYLDVADAGVVLDLDTPDDVARAGLPPPPSNF